VSFAPHLRRARRRAGVGDGSGAGAARTLGVLGLALVLLSAMDSIRNLPSTATFGWACVFFYVIAVVTYLVPVAFTSAELATAWPQEGGIYAWVREAYGSKWGFLAVWCDWSENLAWFPTVLLFLATTAAYVVDPTLSTNKAFLVVTMLGIFWGTTIAAMAGASRVAHWIGRLVVFGTAVPTAVVIVLGLWWLGSDKPSQIPFSRGAIVPEWEGLASLVYVAGIVVAFAGMEIGGYYARQVRDQKRVYPMAVGVAGVVVAALSILGSLAIAVVVPKEDISLSGGVMQALTTFFDDLDVGWAVKPVGVLVIVGVIGSLVSWAIGPAMGMQRVAAEGAIAPWWSRQNRRGAPVSVLVLQALVGTVLSLLLLFVDDINTYYWMLTALVAQTFLVMYLLMYAAVLKLRRTQPDAPRPFRIPGGRLGLVLVVGVGVAGSVFTFALGFLPASHLSVDGTVLYVLGMVLGIVAVCGTPFLLHRGEGGSTAAPLLEGAAVDDRATARTAGPGPEPRRP
jgi:amino acid transporter